MYDLDLCLEVVSRSHQPLRYIWRWISRKPLEIHVEVWFQRTTNRKWSRNLLELETSNLVAALYWECLAGAQIIFPESGRGLGHVTLQFWYTIEHISKITWATDFEFGRRLCMGNAEQAHKKFPWKWAWPRSRDCYNFWQYGRLS